MSSRESWSQTITCPKCNNEEKVAFSENDGYTFMNNPQHPALRLESTLQRFSLVRLSSRLHEPTQMKCECGEVVEVK